MGKFIWGLIIGVALGLFVGMNIGQGKPIFSNPFAEQPVAEEIGKAARRVMESAQDAAAQKAPELKQRAGEIVREAVDSMRETTDKAMEKTREAVREVTSGANATEASDAPAAGSNGTTGQ